MISILTRLVCADNTGAKTLKCIGVLGPGKGRKVATVGRVITVSVKTAKPIPQDTLTQQSTTIGKTGSSGTSSMVRVKPGEVYNALVIRCRKEWQRRDGRAIRFDDNAAVLLTRPGKKGGTEGGSGIINAAAKKEGVGKYGKPLGTRVYGPVPLELRKGGWLKMLSLASRVI